MKSYSDLCMSQIKQSEKYVLKSEFIYTQYSQRP